MLVLSATTDNIQVVLAGAITTNQLPVVTAWRDITTTTYTADRTIVNTNNTTDVNIVPAPAASTQRVVDLINIFNADTVPATVTVKFDVSGTDSTIAKATLGVGERLQFTDENGWQRYDALGRNVIVPGRLEMRFGETTSLGTTYTLIGTVPTSKRWEVGITVANRTAGTVKLRAYVADTSWSSTEPTAGTLKAAIAYDSPIVTGDVIQITGIVMNAAEKLVVRSDTATSLDITASGVEVSV